MKSYCVKQKKVTLCVPGSERYEKAKNGRLMLKCICSECGITKTKFVEQSGNWLARRGGAGILDTVASTGADLLIHHGIPWLGKKAVEMGRYYTSEAIRNPKLQKKAIDYALDKLNPMIQNVGSQALNQLSTKIRPNRKYKTDRKDLDGGALDIHKAIGMLPKPKSGWTLPGHKYTGPYNDLDSQVKYDPVTGEILEIYDKPTGKTDAIAMQHDVDYSVCKDDKKCKNKADRKMVKSLDSVPYNERQWGHWLARNMINMKQTLGLGVNKGRQKTWQEKLADELHKPIKRDFTRRRVIVNHIDEVWCSDLVEMQQFSKWNKGFRYLLMVLDVFSKYGWIVPLKDKKGETVAEAFKTIFKEGRKPQYLWTDKGKEYYNKNMKELLEKNGLTLYSTENEEKSSVCERWNRTIKSKMWKQFTMQGNTQYLDMLPKLVKQYNNTKHSSIKMTPKEASKKINEGTVYFNLYGDMEPLSAKPKFKVGDKVRISKYKRNVFDKGYTPNWTEEVFTIDKMQYTNPITYKLKDLRGKDIQGSFYEPELLKAKQDVFRIDKVIRRNYKNKQALVKWKGYSDEFNSWIPMKDLQHI